MSDSLSVTTFSLAILYAYAVIKPRVATPTITPPFCALPLTRKTQVFNSKCVSKKLTNLCKKLPPKTTESSGVKTAWIQPDGMKKVFPVSS
jgi:hypothetical protein